MRARRERRKMKEVRKKGRKKLNPSAVFIEEETLQDLTSARR